MYWKRRRKSAWEEVSLSSFRTHGNGTPGSLVVKCWLSHHFSVRVSSHSINEETSYAKLTLADWNMLKLNGLLRLLPPVYDGTHIHHITA